MRGCGGIMLLAMRRETQNSACLAQSMPSRSVKEMDRLVHVCFHGITQMKKPGEGFTVFFGGGDVVEIETGN